MNLIGIYILMSNMTHVEAYYAPNEFIENSEKFYRPEISAEILNEVGKHCSNFNYSTSSLSRDQSFALPLELMDKTEVIMYARILENIVDRLRRKSTKVELSPPHPEKAFDVNKNVQQTAKTNMTAKPGIGNFQTIKEKQEKRKCCFETSSSAFRKGNRQWHLCKFCAKRHRSGPEFCLGFKLRCKVCSKMNHTESACWFRNLETDKSESKIERKSVQSVEKPFDSTRESTAGKRKRQNNRSQTGENQTDPVIATVNEETNSNKSVEVCNIGSPMDKGNLRTSNGSSHVDVENEDKSSPKADCNLKPWPGKEDCVKKLIEVNSLSKQASSMKSSDTSSAKVDRFFKYRKYRGKTCFLCGEMNHLAENCPNKWMPVRVALSVLQRLDKYFA